MCRQNFLVRFPKWIYRIGDFENAETVGLFMLEQFTDIQDWKDMQQFYESIDDLAGLEQHMNSATARGLLSPSEEWID